MVGVPTGAEEYVKEFAMKVAKEDNLSRKLPRMSDRQMAHLISPLSLTQRSAYIERGINPKLTQIGVRADGRNGSQWALEARMGFEGTEGEEELFQEGWQDTNLKLIPYQKAHWRVCRQLQGG